MKNKWSNYALKDGKVQSSYIREYCNRKKIRKTGTPSDCDSNEQSGKEQPKVEEKVRDLLNAESGLVCKEPTHYEVKSDPMILNDAWVVNLRGKDEESSDSKRKRRTRKRSEEST